MLKNYDINTSSFITDYTAGLKAVIDALSPSDIETIIACLADAYEQGRRIFIIGNGGSAATASHMACDLSKTVLGKVADPRVRRFAVFALTDNMPLITAYANDVSFDLIFAEPLRNLAGRGDLLIVITGSGNSTNVVEAVKVAQESGLKSIGLLGFDGGLVMPLLDHAIVVPSDNYGHIEDAHMILTHLITAYFKEIMERRYTRVMQNVSR